MGDGKSKVILIPCSSYDEEEVYRAMKQGIEMLGGIERFVKKEEKILVKPNFLSAADADRAVTTHPSVIKGMLRILQEAGCMHVKYGDSPGHGSSASAAGKLGISGEVYGASMADMSEEVHVSFAEGITAKEFYFTREVAEADAVISLCKMKTHALERITGAVKNVYGFICGYRKAAGHVKYPNASIFARMLADIHRCIKPGLHIMDGIVAMEGNGPGSGTPTDMKVMLFSTDPVALDTVFCHLVDLDPELVPTNTQGMAMGIGTYHADDIEIQTAEGKISFSQMEKKYGNPQFDVDRKGTKKTFLSRYSDFMTRLSKRPVIDKTRCVKCGICVNHCPVPGKAVNFKKGKDMPPIYDYAKCIRCYCCQEMCPQHAITAGKRKVKDIGR
ncbi:MAG: DUF362 domain-containing protein [Eubacteriales bacterium]|nr:DUF362 domain-containing protein [Eubacteriales bacterium]